MKKLEELGIGRPSTYAPTISTIQQREYVQKGDKKGEKRNYKQFTLKAGKDIKESEKNEIVGNEKGKLWKEYNYSKKEIQKQVPKEKIIIYAIFSCSYLRTDTFMN